MDVIKNATQKECIDILTELFDFYLGRNKDALRSYGYDDHSASDLICKFKTAVKNTGLQFSNVYHANGIGNNNEYTIYIESTDSDGFVVKKEVAKLYYCYGIFGGIFVSLTDLATKNQIRKIGGSR